MGRYWTIHPVEAWVQFQRQGFIVGDPKYIHEDFIGPYRWMMEQMKKRLPDYRGEYPVWVWPRKPDLSQPGHLPENTKGVCLELELDDKNVLLSDFDAWHCVLNNWPLEFEDNEFGENPDQDTITKSWERIFDYQTLWQHPDWRTSTNKLQGTTGKVSIDHVKKVIPFIAAKYDDEEEET